MLIHESTLAAHFALGFLALFGVGEWLRRRNLAPPEVARKFVHVGGCIGAMLFPFAFRSPWSVVALAVLFAVGIGVGQRVWRIRSLDDVDRASEGGLLHPLALGACYLNAETLADKESDARFGFYQDDDPNGSEHGVKSVTVNGTKIDGILIRDDILKAENDIVIEM